MRCKVLVAMLIPLFARDSLAQTRTVLPRFEEASVKPAARCSMQNSIDPGRVALNGDPLKVILMEAFHVKADQISGPAWLDVDCFSVIAKMPEGATREQVPAMLEALLSERFHLAAHKETRAEPGYALVIDNSGPKFKESDPNSSAADRQAGKVLFRSSLDTTGIKGSLTMTSLARWLSGKGYGPVEDLTGLKGKYDIDLSWAPDRAFEPVGQFARDEANSRPSADLPPAPAPDLFAAVRASLGLRLERRKEQVEVVVIDHIERVPAEN